MRSISNWFVVWGMHRRQIQLGYRLRRYHSTKSNFLEVLVVSLFLLLWVYLECTGVDWPLMIAMICAAWGFVIVLLIMGISSSGKMKIIINFAQTVQLLIGPDQSLLSYFSFINFKFESVDSTKCLAPLDFYWRSFVVLNFPVIFGTFVLITYGLMTLWKKIEPFCVQVFLTLREYVRSCRWRASVEYGECIDILCSDGFVEV